MTKVIAAFALGFVLVPLVAAQQQTFVADPERSEVKITLKTTHEVVHGTFHIQSGSVGFDPGADRMSGSVAVLADSGKTGNGSRDKKMKKEILEDERYATVSFAPNSYTGTLSSSGDSSIGVNGIFTLLGTAHDITIPMVVHLDGTAATAKAEFVVPYIEWGLKDPSFLFWKADKEVAVELSLTGRLSK